MTALNHFQTYHQRENHVTNNTMLMLRHVYRAAPKLLEEVLNTLLEDEDLEIGPRFEQQVGASHSIPDAILGQKPLHVYVEAKRHDDLYQDQVERHIQSIADQGHQLGSAFLIGLTSHPPKEADADRWRAMARERGITYMPRTYGELVEALLSTCGGDPGLSEILDDYQTFIGGENLLPDQYRKLVAMLCGTSWAENVAHGAYFEPAHRNAKWTRAHFLGVYTDKRISHLGRLEAVALCRKDGGALVVEHEEFGTLTDDHRRRIDAIMEAATYYAGLGDETHRYYLVDRFARTDFRKTSFGGMMGHRYLDIPSHAWPDHAGQHRLSRDATSEDVASLLDGRTYQ